MKNTIIGLRISKRQDAVYLGSRLLGRVYSFGTQGLDFSFESAHASNEPREHFESREEALEALIKLVRSELSAAVAAEVEW